jgi:hypothetical protein
VTSRDQIAKLAEPTAPYLDHPKVRSRARRGKKDNKVIGSPVRDNKRFGA